MSNKLKYFVVWKGRQPGIYPTWEETAQQILGFPGAEYKSFPSMDIAEIAYQGKYEDYIERAGSKPKQAMLLLVDGPELDSYCVDAACSGNPGRLEFRGVYSRTGREVFRRGPFEHGTNNVGEFLAIVHILSLLNKMGMEQPVYSDSETAMTWVENKHCKTQLRPTEKNQELFVLISKAEVWLAENEEHNLVLKWDTHSWGEIPADFGRK